MNKQSIAVLGGGSWGATLASYLVGRGHDVSLWEFVPAVADRLQKLRTLSTLPQLKLPQQVAVTNKISEALQGRQIVLCVVPSHTIRATFSSPEARRSLPAKALVINASKGIEEGSNATISQVIRESFPSAGDIVILSGPSHAEEVAMGQPVVLVSASQSPAAAERVSEIFLSDTFRVYTSNDPTGVELGGALKNIYALASGIIDGLSLGDNTKAALMSRGLMEMTRLGSAMGAHRITFFGLSGLGDLIVTCSSKHSRNRLLGEKIGSGKTLNEALAEMTMVAEGVNAARSAYNLGRELKVELPIINEMYEVLFKNKSPRESIKDLMHRHVGAEMEGIAL